MATRTGRKAAKKKPAKAAKKTAKAAKKTAKAAKKSVKAGKAAGGIKAGGKGKIPVNHIAFVVDRSGSMSGIKKDVVRVFNDQLSAVKDNAKKDNQETFVSFYTFQSTVDKPLYFQRQAQAVKPLKSISTTGMTALLDAVGTAITDLQKIKGGKDAHVSFLVIVLTDGEENRSKKWTKKNLPKLIRDVQKTGRWSLAFLAPKSGVSYLKKFGIPAGNIQDWDATASGATQMGQRVRRGLDDFFTARRGGKKAVTGFFKADLTKVTTADVKHSLVDVSKQFSVWKVDEDQAVIRPWVNKKLKGKGAYQTGKGYYELTKSELVQAKKEIAIMDTKTKKIFAGMEARQMLGFPDGVAFKVKPGSHGNFAVFVMSTSNNRVLVKGTTFLYRN